MNRHQGIPYLGERGLSLGGCLIAAFVGVLILGGLGFGAFLWGKSEAAKHLTDQLRENPVIVMHIGEITDLELEAIKTGTMLANEEIVEGVIVWSIEGSKGSGMLLIAELEETDTILGELVMQDGQAHNLYPDGPAPKTRPVSADPKSKEPAAEKPAAEKPAAVPDAK